MDAVDGVHARLAVETDCPLAALSERVPIRRFVPGGTSPQVLVETCPGDLDEEFLDPVVTTDEAIVCRVDPEAFSECDSDPCLARGFEFLPVAPYNLRWQDGHLHLSIAARNDDELQETLRRLQAAGIEVEPRQLATDAVGDGTETAVIDLAALTERQRTLAARAVAADYFDPDGPSAEELAAELDINKATLSEHLRTVQREFLRQAFVDVS